VKPRPQASESKLLKPAGGVTWKDVEEIDELGTQVLLFELLNKSLQSRCLGLGLQAMDERTVFFPAGLVAGDRIRFAISGGRRSTCGFGAAGGLGRTHFRYHLGFILRARHGVVVGGKSWRSSKLRLHVTDGSGQTITPALAFRRGHGFGEHGGTG
jgi:hypothetical protein